MSPARRATANIEAPVWKSYVAARIESQQRSDATTTMSSGSSGSTMGRTRKRAKPSTCTNSSADAFTFPLSSVNFSFTAKPQLTTRANVRTFWEALSVQERMQLLFVDDPDLVKQLYKLNLSLLCVGLMQRHLKTGTTTPSAAPRAAASSPAAVTAATHSELPGTMGVQAEESTATAVAPPSRSDPERTYDLLEAMEFMDIGTGILTVKTELVDDVDRMFALLIAVLHGFLTSIHLLSDLDFKELFVTESEVINTWEDYEKIIAMLVEQLILRGYVAHLEKQATLQMEALLLEASVEDTKAMTIHTNKKKNKMPAVSMDADSGAAGSGKQRKKNKKKKKKTKTPQPTVAVLGQQQPVRDVEMSGVDEEDEDEEGKDGDLHDSGSEPEQEADDDDDDGDDRDDAADFQCSSECSTEDADLSGPSSPVKSLFGKKSLALHALNPHAQVFQPTPLADLDLDPEDSEEQLKSPVGGKRKLDEFIIHIPWQDLIQYDDEAEEEEEDQSHQDLGCRRRQSLEPPHEKKLRRQEEDAELQWHLQHMYASTSSMLGWDFTTQREISLLPPSEPWGEAALWRTAPRDVVRYYFPPQLQQQHATSAMANIAPYGGDQWISPSSSLAGPPSRYYFSSPLHAPPMPPPPGTLCHPPPQSSTTTLDASSLYPRFLPPSAGAAPVSFWQDTTAAVTATAHCPPTNVLAASSFPTFHHVPVSTPRRNQLTCIKTPSSPDDLQ